MCVCVRREVKVDVFLCPFPFYFLTQAVQVNSEFISWPVGPPVSSRNTHVSTPTPSTGMTSFTSMPRFCVGSEES